MNDRTGKSLDELLGQLPRDVDPPRNLWHGIVYKIARRRALLPMALAATAACAVLAGMLVWAVLRARSESPAVPLPMMARASGLGEPMDAKYVAARAELESTFQERLKQLDPATRTQIEASLAVIRQAHADIRKALAASPGDPMLERLFESTWHEEFDLYDHVVRATQPTSTRT